MVQVAVIHPTHLLGREPVQVTAAVITVAVIVASIALMLVWKAAYTAARAEQSSRQLVTARLLEAAGPPVVVPYAPVAASPQVPAQWTTADGDARTGQIHAEAYQPAGTTVSIWIDTAGNPTPAPASLDEAVTRAALLVALTGSGLGAVIILTARLTSAGDRRRRHAVIDREWEQLEAAWTRRYR